MCHFEGMGLKNLQFNHSKTGMRYSEEIHEEIRRNVVWGDQPGLTTQMKQLLQSFQNRFAKKIVKAKMTSAEALALSRWVPLHVRRIGHRCCLVQDALKGKIPEHFRTIPIVFF